MEEAPRRHPVLRRLVVSLAVVIAALGGAALWLPHADGPVWVIAGGPFRTGEKVAFSDMDWQALDARSELEIEIVGAESSRILWFSVYDGAPYVACDLDCVGGRLARWPQQIDRDDRVVIRLDGKRVAARLVHVPHGTEEYAAAREARLAKYSGDGGARAAVETAAHDAVVEVGEVLTGRDRREEPGDRMYRADPRPWEE